MAERVRFVWYDLMTGDPEAAAAFYSDAIGWRLTSPRRERDRPGSYWASVRLDESYRSRKK